MCNNICQGTCAQCITLAVSAFFSRKLELVHSFVLTFVLGDVIVFIIKLHYSSVKSSSCSFTDCCLLSLYEHALNNFIHDRVQLVIFVQALFQTEPGPRPLHFETIAVRRHLATVAGERGGGGGHGVINALIHITLHLPGVTFRCHVSRKNKNLLRNVYNVWGCLK